MKKARWRSSDENELVWERPMLARVVRDLPTNALVVRATFAVGGQLTAIHEDHRDISLIDREETRTWLTATNPFLTDEQRRLLDGQGLRPLSSVIRAGDVLASVLQRAYPMHHEPASIGQQWVRDASLLAPAHWDGARLVAIDWLSDSEAPTKSNGLVRFTVQMERELALGDMLLHEGEPLGLVGAWSDDLPMPIDILIPEHLGTRRALPIDEIVELTVSKADDEARTTVQRRNVGRYSLISFQPMGDESPGQRVTRTQIEWLWRHGYRANVAELVSLKSDSLRTRSAMQALAERASFSGADVPEPAAPESLLLVQSLLLAIGLSAVLDTTPDGVTLALAPLSTEEIQATSNGIVQRPDTINVHTYAPMSEGLFGEQIFGPEAQTCRRRWGHIPLPRVVVSHLWRRGKPSLLESLLNQPSEVVEELVNCQRAIRREGERWIHSPIGEAQGEGWLSGGDAMAALLAEVPTAQLPDTLQGDPQRLITHSILVLPPDFRPLVLLANGNFAITDVNDLYRRIINRANRLRKLDELKAPPVILYNEHRMLQQAYDHLIANSFVKTPCLGSNHRPMLELLQMLRGALDVPEKRVDWSGQARVLSAAIPSEQILLPTALYETLRLATNQPVLVTNPADPRGTFAALLPQPHDSPLIYIAAEQWERLHLNNACDPRLMVHRPLGTEANHEAAELMHHTPTARPPLPDRKSWVEAPTMGPMLTRLLAAVRSGTPTIFDTPRSVMIAGVGSIDFADDTQRLAEDIREVPC